MKAFPRDFAEILTPKGRRVLEGRASDYCGALAAPERHFLLLDRAIDRAWTARAHAALAGALLPHMAPLSAAIPPESISFQTRNHQERLRKTARMWTAYLVRRDSLAWAAAERLGLIAMMESPAYRRFAEMLAGRTLARRFGRQVLAYGPGDYAGPHTDHHPEDGRARDGYIDLHLTLGTPDVAHQYLVYALNGHFSEIVNVNQPGAIAAYRLPFWHYTTPLKARPGREKTARRFVILGTFLYE